MDFKACFIILGVLTVSTNSIVSGILTRSKKCQLLTVKRAKIRIRNRGRIGVVTCLPGYRLYGDKYVLCEEGQWVQPIPSCTKSGCSSLVNTITNGKVLESIAGVAFVSCKEGYTLSGSSTLLCNGFTWNDTAPICYANKTTVNMSCDFENNSDTLCGWVNDENDHFNWQRHSLATSSSGTGPEFDHTLGSGLNGHYLYIEASRRETADIARLISPKFPPISDTEPNCFIFWYHMYGGHIGELNVYQGRDLLFNVSGNQGKQWIKTIIPINNTEPFQLMIEGVRGTGYAGDIAIDDLKLANGLECVQDERKVTESTLPGSCKDRCNGNWTTITDLCYCHEDCHKDKSCCFDFLQVCGLERVTSPITSKSNVSKSINSTTILLAKSTTPLPTGFESTTSFPNIINSTVLLNQSTVVVNNTKLSYGNDTILVNTLSDVLYTTIQSNLTKTTILNNNPIELGIVTPSIVLVPKTNIDFQKTTTFPPVSKSDTTHNYDKKSTVENPIFHYTTEINLPITDIKTEVSSHSKLYTNEHLITPSLNESIERTVLYTKSNESITKSTTIRALYFLTPEPSLERFTKRINTIKSPVPTTKYYNENVNTTESFINEMLFTSTKLNKPNNTTEKIYLQSEHNILFNISTLQTSTTFLNKPITTQSTVTKRISSSILPILKPVYISTKLPNLINVVNQSIHVTEKTQLYKYSENKSNLNRYTDRVTPKIIVNLTTPKITLSTKSVLYKMIMPTNKWYNYRRLNMITTTTPRYFLPVYNNNRKQLNLDRLKMKYLYQRFLGMQANNNDSIVNKKWRHNEIDKGDQAYYRTDNSITKPQLIVGIALSVMTLTVIIGTAVCYYRIWKINRRRSSDDDSDVQFLTSDELINFNVARPSPDRQIASSSFPEEPIRLEEK